jgi:hypothetical protein
VSYITQYPWVDLQRVYARCHARTHSSEAKMGVQQKVTQHQNISSYLNSITPRLSRIQALRHRRDRSTLPISLHAFPHCATISRSRAWSRGLCFWRRDGLGCWFRLYTAADASGFRATTDANIEVDICSVKVVTCGLGKIAGGHMHTPGRE